MPTDGQQGNSLFDSFERVDDSICGRMDSMYSFLNRSAWPIMGLARQFVDQWFSQFPLEAKPDLRERFMSPSAGQHLGAWWEIYLFAFYSRLGYSIIVGPTPNQGGRGKPDFLVSQGDEEFYVEVSVLHDQGSQAEDHVLAIVDSFHHPDFALHLESIHEGNATPSRKEVLDPLTQWLASLDPDEILTSSPSFVRTALYAKGWKLTFSARPLLPEQRGRYERTFASRMFPARSRKIGQSLRKKLGDKVKQSGQLDKPLVIAVLTTSAFMGDDEVEYALFGSPTLLISRANGSSYRGRAKDGFWGTVEKTRHTRVSAVLFGRTIQPYAVQEHLPACWINPWAAQPITSDRRIGTYSLNDGTINFSPANTTARELFELTEAWPSTAEWITG